MSNTSTTTSLADSVFARASQGYPELLSQVAAISFLIWDIIITFDQEVELIWRAPNSIVKYLFLFIRYGGVSQGIVSVTLLLGEFTTKYNVCQVFLWYFLSSSLLLLWAVDIILVYRAFAFCGRDRRILICLVILWVSSKAALLVISVLIILEFSLTHVTTGLLFGILNECDIKKSPKLIHDLWISEVIFQSLLFLLVLGRFLQLSNTWKEIRNVSNLYVVFIRDGTWVYVHLLGLFIASAAQSTIFGLSLIQWAIISAVITSSRLVLNLRSLNTTYPSSWTHVVARFPKLTESGLIFDTMREPVSVVALTQSSGSDVEHQNPSHSDTGIYDSFWDTE